MHVDRHYQMTDSQRKLVMKEDDIDIRSVSRIRAAQVLLGRNSVLIAQSCSALARSAELLKRTERQCRLSLAPVDDQRLVASGAFEPPQ